MHFVRLSKIAIENGFAYGWAFKQGAPELGVHLYVDGKHVATERTGCLLPKAMERLCGAPPAPDAGFGFALPLSVLDGFGHSLHVAVPDEEGEGLYGEVLTFKSAAVRGEVRQQGRLFVGTIWWDSLPRRPAQLLVTGEGGELVHKQALSPAKVTEAEGYPASFSIDRDQWPEGLLHFKVDGQALRGSPCRRSTQLVGMVEEISAAGIRGWAFDGADPRRPIELLLRIDGRDAAWFRPNVRRPEIAKQVAIPEESWGLVGFEVVPPHALLDGEPHRVEVVLAAGGQALNKGHQVVRLAPVGTRWNNEPGHFVPPARTMVSDLVPVVSAVILSRNGAALLDAFLRSWEAHQSSVPAEIIVIDHASTDDSLMLLRRWQGRLPLTVIALDQNASFSESSNLGAARARGQYLLFVNNDIVWLQDVLPRLLESLQDPLVGIAGLKLLKIVGESRSGEQFASEVQHLGVRFKLNDRGYWPYEAAPSNRHREAEYAPQAVPAVTGAALMCRRDDFEQVGGFDPAYFYGFEDVELCLRLAYRLRKSVVCRNDCVALHHHGHTRLSGRELSIYERLMRNSAVLQGHIGIWIKQAYWRSLLQADGYITSEPMTIGIVVDDDPAGAKTALVRAATKLAQQLALAMPRAEIVLLEPARDWKRVTGLHVVIVGDPRYDIRTLGEPRADLLTVAWLWDKGAAAHWPRLPWWRDFGACLAPQRTAARIATRAGRHVHAGRAGQPWGELLSPRGWRLRVAIHVPCSREELEGSLPFAAQAVNLRGELQRAGSPCWLVAASEWESHPAMADVCITLWGAAMPKGAVPTYRSDVVNVLWLLDAGARVPAKARSKGCLVTREMPQVQWLEQQMEERVGSTFSPP